ncbi:MAG: hypothetical protein ACYC9O_16505 [Candidatus Latescibacterota bacterium]
MKEKKRKDAAPEDAVKNDTQSMNYEELLNGFAFEGETKDDTAVTRGDLDGLALAELLGEEEQPAADNASGSFDTIAAEDYSSLARQFDELDLSLLAEEAEEEEKKPEAGSADEEAAGAIDLSTLSIDEADLGSGEKEEDYSSFLGELEKASVSTPLPIEEPDDINLFDLELPEEMAWEAVGAGETDLMNLPELDEPVSAGPAPENFSMAAPEIAPERDSVPREESEEQAAAQNVLDIVNLADDSGFSEEAIQALQAYSEAEAETKPESEPESMPVSPLPPEGANEFFSEDEEGVFSLNDLFDETDSSPESSSTVSKTPLHPLKSIAEPKSAVPPEKTEMDFLGLSSISPAGKSSKRADVSMEVLFEGVEMSFSEQIDTVTLGELLLAQGKKKEAVECFQEVAKKKGMTNWVAKRLRLLSSNSEK